MTQILWMVMLAIASTAGYLCWRAYRKWEAGKRAEDDRFANFMAETMKSVRPATAAAAPAATPNAALAAAPETARSLAQEKLLFEAAAKAGDAGEPALAIRLYARLLARYPGTDFAEQARAGVEAQKRKLSKA